MKTRMPTINGYAFHVQYELRNECSTSSFVKSAVVVINASQSTGHVHTDIAKACEMVLRHALVKHHGLSVYRIEARYLCEEVKPDGLLMEV